MHADLNFKLVRIIYTLREKKMYVACSRKLHNLLQNNNTKRLNKIEKVNTHIHDNSLSLLGAGISI